MFCSVHIRLQHVWCKPRHRLLRLPAWRTIAATFSHSSNPYDGCRNLDIERFPYTYFNHLVAQFIYSLTASLHLIEHGTWLFQMNLATCLHIHLVLCGSTLSISAVKVDHEQQFVDNVAVSQAIYGNLLSAVFLMLQRPHRFSFVSVTVAKGVRLTITMCHRPGSFSS